MSEGDLDRMLCDECYKMLGVSLHIFTLRQDCRHGQDSTFLRHIYRVGNLAIWIIWALIVFLHNVDLILEHLDCPLSRNIRSFRALLFLRGHRIQEVFDLGTAQ